MNNFDEAERYFQVVLVFFVYNQYFDSKMDPVSIQWLFKIQKYLNTYHVQSFRDCLHLFVDSSRFFEPNQNEIFQRESSPF